MKRNFDLNALRRRVVEIDYKHKHRHLPGSLSALPIIAEIYSDMDLDNDVFILSKGHSCAAHYAVLEELGYQPDVSLVHPEHDPENGIWMTAGSLGHGLPTAVGMAWAKKHKNERGIVHVLLGDGECQEGTTWEALHLASRFDLGGRLVVHVDWNGYQGSDGLLTEGLMNHIETIFPIEAHFTRKGYGVKRFEDNPIKSVHLVTAQDYAEIMEELSK
jgi:transketolase N-terminal domain/subunit